MDLVEMERHEDNIDKELSIENVARQNRGG
jgi:hypothetical protein